MIIQFIWCGNMWKLLLQSLLDNWISPKFIYVQVQSQQSKEYISKHYWVNIGKSNDADILILAIKPQQLEQVDLTWYKQNLFVLSILAWVNTTKIRSFINTKNIMRVMPNVSLKVRNWTSWYYYEWDKKDYRFVLLMNIFTSLWVCIEIIQERMIDAVTAISWSWPAYFYYLVELLTKSALDLWFDLPTATNLATNTFLWAALLMEQTDLSPMQLRGMITSKGWTTQAAIESFEKRWFDKIFNQWVLAAYNRAQELNN